MSDTTTQGVRIQARPFYVRERSSPVRGHYFFAYEITITNLGNEPVQLLSRHWIITDGAGHSQDVKGPGVVGETPRLAPDQSFRYTSFCPLPTPSGNMRGAFQMVRDNGEEFDALIDAFELRAPNTLN